FRRAILTNLVQAAAVELFGRPPRRAILSQVVGGLLNGKTLRQLLRPLLHRPQGKVDELLAGFYVQHFLDHPASAADLAPVLADLWHRPDDETIADLISSPAYFAKVS